MGRAQKLYTKQKRRQNVHAFQQPFKNFRFLVLTRRAELRQGENVEQFCFVFLIRIPRIERYVKGFGGFF